MRRKLSRTFEHSIPVLAFLAFASLIASGCIWASDPNLGPNSPGPHDPENTPRRKVNSAELNIVCDVS